MRYTARRKLALLTIAKRLWDEEGISLRKFTERVQVSAAGCEGLVVWVGCGSGCEGCVGWLFVLQASAIYLLSCKAHKHKCAKKLATNSILGILGKLLMRQTKLLHLIKADL